MKRAKVYNNELNLIDKPKGISSFDVIRELRKRSGIKKMGHAGTLDPLASGLLLIGVGTATKELTALIGLPKTYETEVLLGEKRTTGDMEGEILKEEKVGAVDIGQVETLLAGMRGDIELPIPVYSAVKRGGVPLYKLAREGRSVTPPRRGMHIEDIRMTDHFPEGERYVLKLEMDVGSGTYVRAVAEEIGVRLGLPAVVRELRRVKIGNYDVRDALTLEDIKLSQ